jgi:hypothetical protein
MKRAQNAFDVLMAKRQRTEAVGQVPWDELVPELWLGVIGNLGLLDLLQLARAARFLQGLVHPFIAGMQILGRKVQWGATSDLLRTAWKHRSYTISWSCGAQTIIYKIGKYLQKHPLGCTSGGIKITNVTIPIPLNYWRCACGCFTTAKPFLFNGCRFCGKDCFNTVIAPALSKHVPQDSAAKVTALDDDELSFDSFSE